jgi:hypothetical protein
MTNVAHVAAAGNVKGRRFPNRRPNQTARWRSPLLEMLKLIPAINLVICVLSLIRHSSFGLRHFFSVAHRA